MSRRDMMDIFAAYELQDDKNVEDESEASSTDDTTMDKVFGALDDNNVSDRDDYDLADIFSECAASSITSGILDEQQEDSSPDYNMMNVFEEYDSCTEEDFDYAASDDKAEEELQYEDVLKKNMFSNAALFKVNTSKELYGDRATDKPTAFDIVKRIFELYQICYLGVAPTRNRISIFNGRYWVPAEKWDLETVVYSVLLDNEKRELGSLESFVKNCIFILKHEVYERQTKGIFAFTEKDFRHIENHAVFQNIVVDAKTMTQYNFNPNLPYYLGLNANYTKKSHAKHFYKLLKDATAGDEKSIKSINAYIGYMCIPNLSGKAFGFMGCAKDSGKSLLGNFINKSIANSITIDMDQLSSKFAFSRFETANVVSCLELTTEKLNTLQTANLKKFTGEKTLRSEAKYCSEKEIDVRFKSIFAGNGPIRLKGGYDEAFFRRLIILPFIYSTPKELCDASLDSKLDDERDIILSDAVRTIGIYIDDNNTVYIPESDLAKKLKSHWKGASSSFEKFVQTQIMFTGDPDDVIPVENVYLLYREFAANNGDGIEGVMLTKRNFKHEILEQFPGAITKKRRLGDLDFNGRAKGVNCFIGLAVSSSETDM